jgi:cytidylate kinase
LLFQILHFIFATLKPIIIAIDGFSSCGKSTLARELARKLNYRYIDTGAMYRAVTLYFIENNISIEDAAAIENALKEIHITFIYNSATQQSDTYLNGQNREQDIRSLRVANLVSPVSAISSVRRFLVKQQQQMGSERAIVMDGRDIGTVVFPDAELKIFMTARDDIRAKRRFDELVSKNQSPVLEEVAANLKSRDHIDSTRADSPLKKADDAIELDNSDITREEQFKIVHEWAMKVMAAQA